MASKFQVFEDMIAVVGAGRAASAVETETVGESLNLHGCRRSEGGLYMDMNSFLGFGREYVAWNFEKSENPVYLHIMERRKPEPDETYRPLKNQPCSPSV
ncbi:hypothetical protein ZWY2020_034265 [Hordeum vulgare]|nr:hypothetical protein ZWY2020_034265 [Hordeum vulgare]